MYRRGPLHPVQPPPSSDPLARDFVPGPFNHPRLRQTYESTVAVDLLTLAYQHPEPKDSSATGAEEGEEADEEDATSASFGGPHEERRLRRWDGSSPYHKNRPLRPARGRHGLRPIEHPITFRNVPRIESVSLSMFEPDAIQNPDRLTVAMAVMRNITMTVPEIIRIKTPVPAWRTIKGRPAGVKTRIWGDRAYEFVDKCVNFVFPRIKEWPGVKGKHIDHVTRTMLHHVRSLADEVQRRPET